MSVHVSSWAWKQKTGGMAEKLVLLKLADNANEEGMAFPRRRAMIAETGLSPASITRALRGLRDAGLLHVEPRTDSNGRQASNRYWLLVSEQGARSEHHPLLGETPSPAHSEHPITLNRQLEPSIERKPLVDQGRLDGLDPVQEVWATYRGYHPAARLTTTGKNARSKLIRAALKEYPVDVLVAAVHGNHQDPHANGQNDRQREYHDLELILRDAKHIEQYAGLHVSDGRMTTADLVAWRDAHSQPEGDDDGPE